MPVSFLTTESRRRCAPHRPATLRCVVLNATTLPSILAESGHQGLWSTLVVRPRSNVRFYCALLHGALSGFPVHSGDMHMTHIDRADTGQQSAVAAEGETLPRLLEIVVCPDRHSGVSTDLAGVVRGVRVADVQVRLTQWASFRVRLVTSR